MNIKKTKSENRIQLSSKMFPLLKQLDIERIKLIMKDKLKVLSKFPK